MIVDGVPYGVTVEWFKPQAEIDFENLVEGVDFRITRQLHACSKGDSGEPISGLSPNMEWLAEYTVDNYPDGSFDFDVFLKNTYTRPSLDTHPEFPNYRTFKSTTNLIRRDDSVIIENIEVAENTANLSLIGGGVGVKINALLPDITQKLSNGNPLNETEQYVYNVHTDIKQKVLNNADNANNLKAAILRGENPNIKAGWSYTAANTGGYPFS